jgi:hypothetical protein
MTSDEIKEGNNLISDFMGYSFDRRFWIKDGRRLAGQFYLTDWNMLMKVVEKIESLGHPVYISSNNCIIYEHTGKDHGWNIDSYSSSKIESCWLACVHFVEKLINNNK